MRVTPRSPREILHELPWLAASLFGLVAMFVLEHFVVHKQIVLPALEITAEPPLWMWGSMFVPELVVFFAAGWRLRSWGAVGAYALLGAAAREYFHYQLARLGEPGHATAFGDPFSDFAVHWPAVTIAYVLVLGLAAWSGQHERQLLAGA